ncbi:hypothetical protein BDZ45DRAFT_730994 [Acephala macrosclerotiorum]|nr:hypothetical protein BDZ45DRAFT_730994 [Acephala macrosclerotiorum]
MEPAALPTRLIVCVDGTWCTPDGPIGNPHNNISNIYRIYASIKSGECKAPDGRRFKQEKMYEAGIGSQDDIAWLERLKTGAFGNECIPQIRKIYERCCTLPGHPEDEIWFFGFSRGAYVVRAVAGLLHYLRALTSAGTEAFQKDYEQTLKVYKSTQKSDKLGPGQIHNFFAANTRAAPIIRFVGAFDTVKAVNDHSLYDITFNNSIQHMRHALALNEDRRAFLPEYVFPEFNRNYLQKRSFIQAWFLGAHLDMGGSAAKDGLSLYPLQWMLHECEQLGLVLEFDGSFGSRAKIDNPLHVVFPNKENPELGIPWSCKVSNELTVNLQDLRHVHERTVYHGNYEIHLNKNQAVYWAKAPRQPFSSEGELLGYCSYAPQGTILHPSIYLILDVFLHVVLESKQLGYRTFIDHWRPHVLPKPDKEFWNEREFVTINEPLAVRILVCGNCGVGKSSLVNTVFGVEVTHSSHRQTGRHDVNEGFQTPERPDLIIHDSGGFEAGGSEEFEAVEKFVTKMSAETEMKDRLHVIWFCIELNSARTKQKATVELFKTVSRFAKNVPIVVVGTKKDQFMGVKVAEARREARKNKTEQSLEAFDAYAEAQFEQRMKEIETELLEIEGGRFDAAVGVSIDADDTESIGQLTETTLSCFNHDKVRLVYIASQVTRIDLKVDMAIAETMRIYKHTVRSALASGFVPGGSSTTRITVATVVCKAIITCFGLPGVSPKTILEIVDSVIWEDMGHNFSVFFAEGIATTGLLMTILSGGLLAPVMVASGAINAPIVVPATTRLFLMLACDVILILIRAWKESTNKCIVQPLKRDIEQAAHAYRQISKSVHKKIKKVVPRHNIIKSFQANRVKESFEEIIYSYKDKFTSDIGQGTHVKVLGVEDDSDDDVTVVGEDEKTFE